MNIFVLSLDPVLAAQYQCNRHVVKMVLETAQLLSSAYESGAAPYKRTHFNHPCSKWTRESDDNYWWLCRHGIALAKEYTYRYGKRHASQEAIEWCMVNGYKLKLPETGLTPFAQAMPDQYKNSDPVIAYRDFYIWEKVKFATWTKRQEPWWWMEAFNS